MGSDRIEQMPHSDGVVSQFAIEQIHFGTNDSAPVDGISDRRLDSTVVLVVLRLDIVLVVVTVSLAVMMEQDAARFSKL